MNPFIYLLEHAPFLWFMLMFAFMLTAWGCAASMSEEIGYSRRPPEHGRLTTRIHKHKLHVGFFHYVIPDRTYVDPSVTNEELLAEIDKSRSTLSTTLSRLGY